VNYIKALQIRERELQAELEKVEQNLNDFKAFLHSAKFRRYRRRRTEGLDFHRATSFGGLTTSSGRLRTDGTENDRQRPDRSNRPHERHVHAMLSRSS
jgi:hypothetical protein